MTCLQIDRSWNGTLFKLEKVFRLSCYYENEMRINRVRVVRNPIYFDTGHNVHGYEGKRRRGVRCNAGYGGALRYHV